MKTTFLGEITNDFIPDLGSLLFKISPFIGTVIFTELFKKYVFSDFNYLIFLAMAILLDTLSKVYFILLNKQNFDFDILIKKLMLKILKYFVFVSSMHIFINLEVEGQKFEFGFYIKYIVYSLLISSDIRSILKNLGVVLPKEVSKYLNQDKDEETKKELNELPITSAEDRPKNGPR